MYHTILLDEEATGRYDQLMDSFCTAQALPGLTEDEVREHPDAITICQAAAIDGKIIVSPDQDFQADRLAAHATPEDMRDHALTVTGGTVTNARRVDGRKDLWELTVEPAGTGAVSILVPLNRACTETCALCTGGSSANRSCI